MVSAPAKRPNPVTGYMSPYPVVVKVTNAHQIVIGTLSNV